MSCKEGPAILCNLARMLMVQQCVHVQVERVRARAVLEQQADDACVEGRQSSGWCGVGCRGAALSDSSVQLGGLVCTHMLFVCVVRMCLARVLCGCGGCSVVVVRAVCAVLSSRSISVLLSQLFRSRSRSGRSWSS